MDKVNIMGVNIHQVTMKEAVKMTVDEFFNQSDEMKIIATPNPEFIMAAGLDEEFKNILNEADLVIPDGIGVVYAARIIGNSIKERVAGYDFTQNILESCSKTGKKVFILGAKPGVAELAAKKMEEKYVGLKIAGTYHGYFKEENEPEIIEIINKVEPDFLILGLGAPRQEKFMMKYKNILKVKCAIGNGGALDGMAGLVKRAPVLFQKLGLEWFYRLLKQPSRFGRMLKLPQFMSIIILDRITGKKY